jgi:transposase
VLIFEALQPAPRYVVLASRRGLVPLWLLSGLGHEVIVAHARNVRLISESRRKDDRLDAQTLARLARIDPQLLCPVKHRSAVSLGMPHRFILRHCISEYSVFPVFRQK